MNSRRQFLIRAPLAVLVTSAGCRREPAAPSSQPTAAATPGAPPTFGTAVGSGPPVTADTFAEAESSSRSRTLPVIRHSRCAPALSRSQARSDWAPDPSHPLPTFSPPRRVPHGITIVGRLFDDGLLGQVGIALEREFAVASERPAGF